MSLYTPTQIPDSFNTAQAEFLRQELNKMARAMAEADSVMRLAPQGIEPVKYQDGDVVFANGTTWNPGGTGRGVYVRSSGAWVKL